ncbi:partner of Y14 and mago [Cyclospora cayetanensis]|uniref:Mago binding protein n=2 Tax=Cyclospora cayetanensis TaxID=88456 RepID=A0A1D3D521_9EIME|nr:partner of Y14 and mago [Cyclospora cayetanensis]OEH78538.1 mago binding protein [Cyclospora cayetanensis]
MSHPDASRGPSSAGGFSELVDSLAPTGVCVRETTISGETYVVNMATGEKIIPGSRRPDGSLRKPIKVRAGYTPAEERRAFRTRQQISRDEHRVHVGGGIPGLTPEADSTTTNNKTTTSRRKKKDSTAPNCSKALETQDKLCSQIEAMSLHESNEANKTADPVKRLRNVRKKINEIIELEKKCAEGQTPTPEQMQKIHRKKDLLAEAAELEQALVNESK